MAFVETRAVTSPRTVMEAAGICNVTLAEAVIPGDPLGISSGTWVRSVSATVEQPLLIALEGGVIGDVIEAAAMAIVTVTTTSSNVATLGELVALKDTGEYQADSAGLPDVGFVVSVGSDSLSAVLCVCPLCPQLTTVRD